MNKLFSKIATLSVGLAMAVGVGVALGRGAVPASAEDASITFTTTAEKIGYNTGTQSNLSMTSSGVAITFSSVTGKTVTPARVQLAKNATITSTEINGYIKSLTVNGYAHTANSADGSFSVKGSADGETFTEVEEHTGLAKDAGTVATTFNVANKYNYFEIANGSSRVMQLSSIVVEYEKQAAKVVQDVTGVHSAPSVTYVGSEISATEVRLDVTYTDSTVGVVTSSSVTCDTSAPGNVKATATYDDATGIKTAQFDIEVLAVAVSSIEKSGTFKTEFTENEAFSFGTGKVKVNYNNGSSENIEPTADGVSVKIGETDITNVTYYVAKADKDKTVTISYAGKSFEYSILNVTDAPVVGGGHYEKVTSESGLVLNDTYIIVSETSNVAMSTTQNQNNRDGASVTISDSKIASVSASVEVFSLVSGIVTEYDQAPVTTYGLKTHDDKYIYASSSTKNYLRTSDTLDDNGSFTITFSSDNAIITAKGTNTHNIIRYNSSSSIFSCYESGQSPVQLYHLISNERTDDQKAVDTFINTYMHLDDVDVNDHSDSGACRGETGYYAVAKEHYNELTSDQRSFFATSEEFRVARARERLTAWAEANGETFNPSLGSFTKLETPTFIGGDTSGYAIIIVVVTSAVLAFGLAIMLRKKHR